jgi:predicted nuclease with TOPRIM domain
MRLVSKTVVVLSLVCVVLAVGLVGAVILLNQKDAELQIKTNQVSELENEKVSLTSQASVLQTNVSSLQSEVTTLKNEKVLLQQQVSPLQTQLLSLQDEVTALATEKSTLETQVSVLQTNVSSLQSEVATLENEKNVLEAQVSPLQVQVLGLQNEVASLEDDKAVLEQQVSVLQTNVESLQTQVETLGSEKDSLEIQVASLTTEVANLEAQVIISYDEGYTQGMEDLLQTGHYFIDPTYDEAIAFIESDETDANPYTPDYVCYDFTADLISNAAQEGYSCGFVYIEFATSAHAIVCFNTTDTGLIFVEPQNDEIVDVAVGQLYLGHVIVKMGIIW